MSTRMRRIDSTSEDTPTTAIDIEAIVKKAVEAATVVIRNEFTKLLKELSDRVREIEASVIVQVVFLLLLIWNSGLLL